MFGISPVEIDFIYLKIQDLCLNNTPKDKPKHLLWALFFLRLYLTEDLNSLVWNTSRSTFRMHVHRVIISIEKRLTFYIRMEERFHDWNEKKKPCFVIDTTHCPIEKSVLEKVINKENKLHTFRDFKHACYSIKYQYIVSMKKPRICNISPGFPGSVHDIAIARISGIVDFANQNQEVGIGDKAYQGERCFVVPIKSYKKNGTKIKLTEDEKRYNKSLEKFRNNVERVNCRIKIFKCTTNKWRHSIDEHSKNYLCTFCNRKSLFYFQTIKRR